MRVLYVSGTCLTKNTSANMSHNAFLQGLVENGCDVDIVMAKDSWGETDHALPVWKDAKYFVFSSVSLSDKLRYRLRGRSRNSKKNTLTHDKSLTHINSGKKSIKKMLRNIVKAAFYFVFRPDEIYPLEKEWLKNAARFQSSQPYDLVISNSSPAASHRLVVELIKNGRVHFERWVQIWEDPWYHDLYGGHSQKIENEEHCLLRAASEVVYVSPLTLMYQKQYYPDCAEKMTCVPLPALKYSNDEMAISGEISFGYFGDYYAVTRNLMPFYEAIQKLQYRCYIYGDSDIHLEKTEKIDVSGRVTLEKLQDVQNKTTMLVHLCNLRGGQIPGKIYHYSVTQKPILFILDGTEEEKKELVHYFAAYRRYYFCDNKVESICKTIEQMVDERKLFSPVKEFMPKEVVKRVIG